MGSIIIEYQKQVDDLKWMPLYYAAEMGNLKIVKYIPQHLEDKNPVNDKGYTPLDIAVEKGHLKIVKILLTIKKHPTRHCRLRRAFGDLQIHR